MNKELEVNIDNVFKIIEGDVNENITKLTITDSISETEDFSLADIFFNFVGEVLYPNLKELRIEAHTMGYEFLDSIEVYDKLEKLSINTSNIYWNDKKKYNETKSITIDIKEKMESLKEINFNFDHVPWKLILSQHEDFPNIEKLTFSDIEDETINSWDLLKFPKLKCILLDQNTEFTEEDSSDLHDSMYMDDLCNLDYLEEISSLVLNDLNSLKKFKKLKKIGNLVVPYSSDESEYIEATKHLVIENNSMNEY